VALFPFAAVGGGLLDGTTAGRTISASSLDTQQQA
jgi:hypothetical protein